ncbi:MAG: hypothetical protein CBC65_001885 [Rhodothermaceae bacterium TMED105]|nr:MAG: hypothetical protein CBC65_001885 [Rhodothermaceae bacterium TMED105]
MSEHGTLFRIRTERLAFRPLVPFDEDNNQVIFGTGFLLKHKGKHYILTNHHVISNARRVTATTHGVEDGQPRQLKVVGMQPHLDVAILEMVEENDARFFNDRSAKCFEGEPGRSSRIKAETRVTVFGFANADRHLHTTSGTVSGRTNWPLNRIQTDAVVNHGNSGGPVVDDRGSFVGIVTSGMDEMQPTNHFVGFDEIIVCLERIEQRVKEMHEVDPHFQGPCSDLGLYINAVLIPVDPSALFERPRSSVSGALVTDALPNTNLLKGDVILGVKIKDKFRNLDSHMMIDIPEVWTHRLDFRVWLDRIRGTGRVLKWDMEVLRKGEKEKVVVNVGPNMLKSRFIYPDCEPVSYIIFHGLVIQMFNENHVFDLEGCDDSFKDPRVNMYSYPMITNTLPECPFTFQDSIRLTGKRVRHITSKTQNSGVKFEEPSSDENSLKDLHEILSIVRTIPKTSDIVLILENGERVGATARQIEEYVNSEFVDGDRMSRRENLALHRVFLPYWKTAAYDVYRTEPIVSRETPCKDVRSIVPVRRSDTETAREVVEQWQSVVERSKKEKRNQQSMMIIGISLFAATCFRLLSK